jgi:hypothetical protein
VVPPLLPAMIDFKGTAGLHLTRGSGWTKSIPALAIWLAILYWHPIAFIVAMRPVRASSPILPVSR